MNKIDNVLNNVLDFLVKHYERFHNWTYSGEKTSTDNQVMALIIVKFILGFLVGFMVGVIWTV